MYETVKILAACVIPNLVIATLDEKPWEPVIDLKHCKSMYSLVLIRQSWKEKSISFEVVY